MQRTRKLSDQVKSHSNRKQEAEEPYGGNIEIMIPTGSTLLNLAISGGRVRGGGIPSGILAEIFGPASSGKTVILCEIAGAVQRQGGKVLFRDPEARLNKEFARLFGLDTSEMEYSTPNTVSEVFKPIRTWDPKPERAVHGAFADSLAALSTDWEMDEKDQYGMRRAKEFSEELRKTCRVIREKNFLVVCSNQVRQNLDAGPYGQKYRAPGGEAIGFYSSLRLRCSNPQKIKKTAKVAGKDIKKVVGVQTEVEVFKSSVWEPYHTAPLYILFDYGIDDIRANLQYIKDMTGERSYQVGKESYKSLDEACIQAETYEYVDEIKKNTINLWEEIESKFNQKRKPKER
jgi:DNA repair protein RadB